MKPEFITTVIERIVKPIEDVIKIAFAQILADDSV